ncbi:TadE/TadG family type IV pilus assembly protein [Aurantiacibacter suaedae]|uniref:TadE/TadG family type IV pilus assembly protein n=1 Tax=Aurantiacibacter suaedae TaxID=2545755 RepID=UPI0010F96989|nr:TadE family protein [Aurantiacibacter suaedae]
MRSPLSLGRNENGAALVEFALIAPVLVAMLLGLFEIGYNMYTQAQLQGTIQRAARDSSIENAGKGKAAIDERVERAVKLIAPRADVDFSRKSYATFSDVAQAEDFTDVDGNGICDNGEQFEDANGNGVWDEDRGKEGLGGARDVVLYKVTVGYPRAFGISKLFGFSDRVEFEASSVLRNQPYDDQEIIAVARRCD